MLDQEWMDLIAEAKHIGLTIEEIRELLQSEEIHKEKMKMTE